jgi:hypothetical protein
MKKISTVLIAVFLSVTAVDAQSFFNLVLQGKSSYVIVIPANARYERQAASILATYITKISGAILPVIKDTAALSSHEILIGSTNRSDFPELVTQAAKLKSDGFCIRTSGSKMIILGGTDKGVIYGVTTFLEDVLGCRKLSPDAEYVPHNADISFAPLDITEVPDAEIRIVNGPICYDEDYKNWRKLAVIADFWNDGDWQGYYVHTFNRLVPAADYFAAHPEYFALVNGKRIPYGQLCLSNPEVLKITIDKLKKEMALHSSVKYWSVSQNDNYDYCQCDRCRAIDSAEASPSGTLLRFVNEVAKVFPDKTITTLAYQYTRKPPLVTRPRSNVMITLCTIELNRSKPIAEDSGSASFVRDIKGWAAICDQIMLWDYEVQFTNYLCPFPLFHTLQPNIQLFDQYHVTAHFQQCNAMRGAEFAELKTYYLSKVLWNPDVDGNAVIHDFMQHYYGAAGPYIEAYLDSLHAACSRTGQSLDIYGSPVHYAKSFLTQECLNTYNKLFDDAEKAVIGDVQLSERVKVARLPILYSIMEIGKSDLFGPRGWYIEGPSGFTVKPEMIQMLEDFYQCCKRNNITDLNENNLTVDQYYESTKRFIDVQVAGNLAFRSKVICSPAPDARYQCNGPSTLTNGVRGTDDYRINWLGWEGRDLSIVLDLGESKEIHSVSLGALQYPKSWILLPLAVKCSYSYDNLNYISAGEIPHDAGDKSERLIYDFKWNTLNMNARYLKFDITATKILPAWHNYTGNSSWVFIDEIVVK